MPANLHQSPAANPLQVICITGAKGGIGKTNVSINLGLACQRRGKQVMLLDADLSLANIDVLLGLNAKRNLSHMVNNDCELKDIVIDGPMGMKIVPASSGVQQLCELSDREHAGVINAFSEVSDNIDLFIVDTAAGVTNQVIHFVRACNEVIVVVCNEPGSITDAYAQIKILSQDYGIQRYHILGNMINSQHEGKLLFQKLKKTADQFLDVQMDYMGCIPFDEHIRLSAQSQKAVLERYPHAKASQAFENIAETVLNWPVSHRNLGNVQFFLDRFVQHPEEHIDVVA